MSEATYPESPFAPQPETDAAATPATKQESWKSQAFINCYHTAVNGKKRKVFSIPLKESVKAEREVIAHLKADPTPESIQKFFSMLDIDFKEVGAAVDDSNIFDFNS
jgi:hypothetical protein